jgi:hypothetical protein
MHIRKVFVELKRRKQVENHAVFIELKRKTRFPSIQLSVKKNSERKWTKIRGKKLFF